MDEIIDAQAASGFLGKKLRRQAELLRLARREIGRIKKIRLGRLHGEYLFAFFRRHAPWILGLLALLLLQGISESVLVVLSRDQLSGSARYWLAGHFWTIFICLALFFLFLAYAAIRFERRLIVLLANGIRRRIFRMFLRQPLENYSSEKQAELVAKISYQLPLVSLGVANSSFGFWRWLVCLGILWVLCRAGGYSALWVIGVFIILSAALAAGSYIYARIYVSQEVTFYSRIIRAIDYQLANFSFIKLFSGESATLRRFDALVWLDSFFRVRRDLLVRFAFKFVFLILIFLSLYSHFFSADFFSRIAPGGHAARFLFIFVIIYLSRGLNEAARVGLYIFPAKLGLFLTVTAPGSVLTREQRLPIGSQAIIFQSHKTKLFSEGAYLHKLNLECAPGDRLSIHGKNLSGKSSFARLLCGISAFNPRSVTVKIGGERLNYTQWQRYKNAAYYIDLQFRSEYSLMECLAGKNKEDIKSDELTAIIGRLANYPELTRLVAADGNFNRSAAETFTQPLRSFALQTLHCLLADYRLIVIDNAWLDYSYPFIEQGLRLLSREKPAACLIIFSRLANNVLEYTRSYELVGDLKPV